MLDQYPTISLQAAGIISLARLNVIPYRTVLRGTASWLDIFVLAPGIHTQQGAPELNGGEWPAVGAMTSGYVFRAENPALVKFLQDVGKPGHLTAVRVGKAPPHSKNPIAWAKRHIQEQGSLATILYLSCCASTVAVLALLAAIGDLAGISIVMTFMLARLVNVAVIRKRTRLGWKGAAEPGAVGDLLVLLSEDRWIRMRGMVDDLKATVSGGWFCRQTTLESFATACATLLVYVAAALAGSASTVGTLLIVALMIVSAGLLGLCNVCTRGQTMYGRYICVEGEPKSYERRLKMAEELIKEADGRDDWAIIMGLIKPLTKDKLQVAIM